MKMTKKISVNYSMWHVVVQTSIWKWKKPTSQLQELSKRTMLLRHYNELSGILYSSAA